jgi:DNA processing protein
MISALDLLTLSQIPHIGSYRLRALVTHFKSTSAVLEASAKEIAAVEGFSHRLASSVAHFLRHDSVHAAREYAERQLSALNRVNGSVLSCWEERYPGLLKGIYDPPPFLFACGEYRGDDSSAIAIVGTRVPSAYGISAAEQFSSELARRGLTVVSGLARGIDTIAHESALNTGGRTFAVTGSGLDLVYPPENRNLQHRIAGSGIVISEYAMGSKPDAVNFPRRNRLVSGLALGTLVIETDLTGGAMITANFALDQGREVFAVPGNITSKRSRGCNILIREGRAKLVECVDDVLVELGPKLPPLIRTRTLPERKAVPDLTLFEKRVYDMLTGEPAHIDLLAGRTSLSTSDLLVNLLTLEFKGLVRQLAGKMFVKV